MGGLLRIAAAAAHFTRNLAHDMQRISRIMENSRLISARLLVLPDGALGGYLANLHHPGAHGLPPALPADDGRLAEIARMAGDLVVCLGFTEQDGAQRYNAAVCLSGDGVLGWHRKVHQPPGERAHYAAGSGFRAFDTPVGRIGMLIDYDKTFPESARTLALDGARLIACPSAWPVSVTNRADRLTQDRQARLFDLYDRARAAENQIVFVSANQTGTLGDLRFLGQSKVVGPGGDVLARTGSKPGLAVTELAVDEEVLRARKVLHHLAERAPDAYRLS